MSEKNNGGPAFARPQSENHMRECEAQTGMTMRDYFAAASLTGLMGQYEDQPDDKIAKYAYEMADAMLRARDA